MDIKHVLVIGQCSLHWGRMEFGNIGNFYIVKPLFEELRRVFPNAVLSTTMQFSDDFCKACNIELIPMEAYFDFERDDNLALAKDEYDAIRGGQSKSTPFIDAVNASDLVIDFSGDMWGDNADFVSNAKDRFYTGLYKDLTAQLLKPTIMLSCSLGPFSAEKDKELITKCLSGFKIVIAREGLTKKVLEQQQIYLDNIIDYPCPSFLFRDSIGEYVSNQANHGITNVGMILCGWNFEQGPFDRFPRAESEYQNFVKMLTNIIENNNVNITLLSHSNGFELPRNPFKLKHGRDYPIVEQLRNLLYAKGYESKVSLLDGIYLPDETIRIINDFDVLISGRMHGAVAGLSQCIPTMIIDYGHEPKAHKLRGYADYLHMSHMIADPNDAGELISKANYCIQNRNMVKETLNQIVPEIKKRAHEQFDYVRKIALQCINE